jgi:peroxiredoxin/outer membrane lipoprotein-sorting protein
MRNLRSEINGEVGEASFSSRNKDQRERPQPLARLFLALGIFTVAFACPHASGAADQPDPMQILKNAAAFYSPSYGYQAEITVQNVDGARVAESHYTEVGFGTSFRRTDSGPSGREVSFDGQHGWILDRATNEYEEMSAPAAPASFVSQLAQIDQSVKAATVDDEEVYDLPAGSAEVYIVEVTRTAWPAGSPKGAQSAIYTIDKKSFEVYKATTYAIGPAQVDYFSFARRNPVIVAHLSMPPATAKQLAVLPPDMPAYKSIIGMEAPDFTLKDSLGHTYSLHDFRGKVVAIDFIGAWCPPCMAQAPYMQQVNDAYPPRDLEVFGLDVGENTKAVGELAFNARFTFPILVGAEPDVTEKYFVDDFPTVYIIGRDGRIVFKATGTDNPGGFLAAVKDAVAKKN